MRADLVVEIHKRADLDKAEKALLLALAITCHKRADSCYPSFEHLTRATGGWGERALRNALRRLERRGIVTVEHRFRNANVYTMHINTSAPDAELRDSSPALNADLTGPSPAPHADLERISPASGAVSPASGAFRSASHDAETGSTCRQSMYEVSNEVGSEVGSEVRKAAPPGRFPPDDYQPNEILARKLKARLAGVDLDALAELFRTMEYRYPRSDWDRAFEKYALTQRDPPMLGDRQHSAAPLTRLRKRAGSEKLQGVDQRRAAMHQAIRELCGDD